MSDKKSLASIARRHGFKLCSLGLTFEKALTLNRKACIYEIDTSDEIWTFNALKSAHVAVGWTILDSKGKTIQFRTAINAERAMIAIEAWSIDSRSSK